MTGTRMGDRPPWAVWLLAAVLVALIVFGTVASCISGP